MEDSDVSDSEESNVKILTKAIRKAILSYLAKGFSSGQIAARLGVNVKTVQEWIWTIEHPE